MWVYLLKLAIAIPILGFGFWAFMKWTQQSALFTPNNTNLSIKDCLRISPKATLQVVQVGDQYLLISVTEQQVTVLKEMTEAESVHWSTANSVPSDQKGWNSTVTTQTIDLNKLKEWKEKCLTSLNKK